MRVPDSRFERSHTSNAASGTSQHVHVATGSTHGKFVPVTVASPPISLRTTAEESSR
jgi:hypothetical protein